MIVYECVHCVTLSRGADRISLKPGARLKITPSDDDFNEDQLRRAIAEGRLRPVLPAILR
jgi:hypothetical protein